MLASILIVSVLIILSSYQNYEIKITRNERDYDAEFKNIRYSSIEEIKKNQNIKEISVTYNIGTSEEDFYKRPDEEQTRVTERINIMAYDENSIKNDKITLLEGRFAENQSEIVISKGIRVEPYIGKKIDITINGKTNTYEVVGIAQSLPNTKGDLSMQFITGAITCFDENKLDESSPVNVAIITKKINKIYDTTNELVDKLKLYETQEEKEANLVYNINLLRYSLVKLQNYEEPIIKYSKDVGAEEFGGDLTKIVAGTFAVIAVTSTIVIYTSFKITYSTRIKELGMLTSIGMNKKQRRKMLFKEALIIGTIGIVLGIVIGIIISLCITQVLDIIAKNIGENTMGEKILINSNIKFSLVIPFKAIAITTILTYIITIISSLFPMRKLNKVSPIEAIRSTRNDDINKKRMKVSKIISKIFKQEGELAYKNIRRDKAKYKTIVVSIMSSIVLFLAVKDLYIENIDLSTDNVEYNISLSNYEEADEEANLVIEKAKERGLVNNYIVTKTFSSNSMQIVLPQDKITEQGRELGNITYNIGKLGEDTLANTIVMVAEGKDFDEILNRFGIEKLGIDECIINDTQYTETGKSIKMIDYEAGDEIIIKEFESVPSIKYNDEPEEEIDEEALKQEQEFLNEIFKQMGATNIETAEKEKEENAPKEHKLRVVGVVSDIDKESKLSILGATSVILISEETAKKWGVVTNNEEDKAGALTMYKVLTVYTDNPKELEAVINEIRENAIAKGEKAGANLYEDGFYNFVHKQSYLGLINNILIYSFLSLIALLSAVNIFTTISSSIILRKKDFAELRSLGMSDKQINKMLLLEGLFYGLDAVIYGLLAGTAVLYVIYVLVHGGGDYDTFPFTLPYMDFTICIVVTYLVIFASIWHTKKKIQGQNIVEEIRNENI